MPRGRSCPWVAVGLPGLTWGELVHQRDAQSWGKPLPASTLGSQAGVAMEGAAPGTHQALSSPAGLLTTEVLQVCAGPLPPCVAQG